MILPGLLLLLFFLSLLAVGPCARFDASSGSRTGPSPLDIPAGTIGEGLTATPISWDGALALILAGRVDRLILQPDRYADGTLRLYTFGDGAEQKRWQVQGVNVLLSGTREPGPVPISTSLTTVGLDEAQLESLLDVVRSANAQGRDIKAIDDRDWWAKGMPIPHEEKVIIP